MKINENLNVEMSLHDAKYIADCLKDVMKYEASEKQWDEGYRLNNMWMTPETVYIVKELMNLTH